jgi:nucleotide-binding universal stress UspA family protein
MTTHSDSSHRPVVVGVDGSPQAAQALAWAATEASQRGAPLVVLQAYSPDYPAVRAVGLGGPPPPQPMEALHEVAQEGCAAAAGKARAAHPDLAVTERCVADDPGKALVDASSNADLVVMGARGLGKLQGLLLGSVSAHVTSRAHCPVVVIREAPSPRTDDPRVVVGVDGSEDSVAAVRFAFEAAARRGAGLTVVHAWDVDVDSTSAALTWVVDWQEADEQERAAVAETLAGYAAEFPTVDVRRHIVRGHPVAELVRESEGAELVVVGTRGRGAVKSLVLGSVSHSVLHDAHCPVAVVTSPHQSSATSGRTARHHEFHLPVPPVREHL